MKSATSILAAAAVLLAGCAAPAPRDEPPAGSRPATPSPTATRAPTVMSRADAFQAALAAAAPLEDGWTGTGTGTVNSVTLCGEELAVPGLRGGVFAESQWTGTGSGVDVMTRDVQDLRAVIVPIPPGERPEAIAAVHALLGCRTDSGGALARPAAAVDEDGIEVVGYAIRYEQKAKPAVVHRAYSAEVVDGLGAVCAVDGVSAEKTTAAARRCTDRVREVVDVMRGAAPATGSAATAASIATRLQEGGVGPVVSEPIGIGRPCLSDKRGVPSAGLVVTKQDTAAAGDPHASLAVQPFDDARDAQRALAEYRAKAASCVGEAVVFEATNATPERRVTRIGPTETSTGDGGLRYSGFFGTATKRTGTSIVTEVFALGPHLVFAVGEGDDLAEAGRLADDAVQDALGSTPSP